MFAIRSIWGRSLSSAIAVGPSVDLVMKKRALLSFDEFRTNHLPSFEDSKRTIKTIDRELSLETIKKIYDSMCRGQYQNYFQRETTANDLGTIL